MRLLTKTIYFFTQTLRQLGVDFQEENNPRIIEMKKGIQGIGGRIEFRVECYPDGSWVAESANIDGIITGGKNPKKMPTVIRDAIFTYFGIPPHLCKYELLRAENEPVKLTQQVYVRT